MSKLPNADKAIVPIQKIRDYSLNPNHDKGKHKARVFASALGFTAKDAPLLREKILQEILQTEATLNSTDEHGSRYTVDFAIEGLENLVVIRTAWIIDEGETVPRLVSCYVNG